ncbi:MAG: ABC transporter substrate-binding protein [Dehalococcoidia bacterium]
MRGHSSWAALLMLLAAAVATFAVACGDDDDGGEATATSGAETPTKATEAPQYDVGASDTEIKIGGIYPFSGPAAAYGTIGKVVEAYFNKVNEEGGVNGRQLKFVTLDDQYSPDKTVQAARQLVEQEKVLFLFNTLGTPTNTAIWDYLNQQEVPHIFVATGASKWGADPSTHPWTLGWQPDYQSESAIYAKYLRENKPGAKVGILFQNDDYGKDYVEGFKKALGADADSVIVKEVNYATTDASVSAQVAQLKESGADVFFLVATPKFAVQALVSASQIGWKPFILLNSVSVSVPAVMTPAIEQGGEDAVSNVITTFYIKDPGDPAWADDPGMNAYFDFMDEYFPEGNKIDAFNVYAYSVATTLLHVLEQCGDNLTRDNVVTQATSVKDLRVDTLLPGILINTGPDDYYPIQAEQIATFNPSTQQWELQGDIIDVSQ